MEENVEIINRVLYTLDLIHVSGIDNHERIAGVYRTLEVLKRNLTDKKEEPDNG